MLRDRTIPNIRYGRRFIISRVAFERWESTIGETVPATTAIEPKPAEAAGKSRSAKAA
jgi:hypothetical protein